MAPKKTGAKKADAKAEAKAAAKASKKAEEPKAEEPKAEEPTVEKRKAEAPAKADSATAVQEPAAKNAKAEEQAEKEKDAPADKRKVLDTPVGFHLTDATMNVVPAMGGRVLATLTEGGLQYLIAGARASVGMKAGRYLFEVKIVEVLPLPDHGGFNRGKGGGLSRAMLRVGVSAAGSSLLLGDSDGHVFFDAEGGAFAGRKRSATFRRVVRDQVMGILVNLDPKSDNKNTVSLFVDGVRVVQPQPLPEGLDGKPLFPHISFRNIKVQAHFGPTPITELPFKCRMLNGGADADVVKTQESKGKDGKYEVVLPVGFPDEGTFDWLDGWLAKNPQYTELSDRKIIEWAASSGLAKHKSFGRSSNDKPEFNFGVPGMDDGSIRRVVHSVAALMPRNYVVMEVKANLTADDRRAALKRFSTPCFKKVAQVVMGEPAAEFKQKEHEKLLKEKQLRANAAWRLQKAEKKRKKELAKRQKLEAALKKKAAEERAKLEVARKKKEEEEKAKLEEALKKKEEEEKAKLEEALKKKEEEEKAKLEEALKKKEEEEKAKLEEALKKKEEEEKAKLEEEKSKDGADAEKESAGEKQDGDKMDVDPADAKKDETTDEKKAEDKKQEPEGEKKEESQGEKKEEPEAEKKEEPAAEKKEEPEGENKDVEMKEPEEAEEEEEEEEEDDAEPPTVELTDEEKAVNFAPRTSYDMTIRDLSQSFVKFSIPEKEEGFDDIRYEWAAEGAAREYLRSKVLEKKKGMRVDDLQPGQWFQETLKAFNEKFAEWQVKLKAYKESDAGKAEADKKADPEAEKPEQKDVSTVEDVADVGEGEPLFKNFAHEDWALLQLRFELFTMQAAYTKDVNDEDRPGVQEQHFAWYYNKYYRKHPNFKGFGVEDVDGLVKLVKDTVAMEDGNLVGKLEAQPTDFGTLVKLCETHRRNRQRSLDAGDETARLKIGPDALRGAPGGGGGGGKAGGKKGGGKGLKKW